MAEAQRLIGLLQTSHLRPHYSKPVGCNEFPAFSSFAPASTVNAESSKKKEAIPVSLVEALQHIANGHQLPPQPTEPLSTDFKVGLKHVVNTLNAILPPGASYPTPTSQINEPTKDIANELAIANCKRILAAKKDPAKLQTIVSELNISLPPSDTSKADKMASRFPVLNTSDLPPATAQETSATASPARGSAMLNSIFKSVRVPEFRFKWQFWAEKGQQNPPSKTGSTGAEEYASRPKALGEQIISVKEFYQHFNNIPVDNLKLRDSIHLFHLGVKPLWEDPRNARGGAYYFRIPKESAPQFWHEICLLAVGDVLQGAVETKRECKSAPI